MAAQSALRVLNDRIIACRMCPRLVAHREQVARVKRRAFREESYWGSPVPGFGDSCASLLIVGLAPAAHGANRTGRMFTGDRSGDFLYARLHEAGFASQAESRRAGDGLHLSGAYVTATVRCAPPGNMPRPGEIAHCRPFLQAEWDLLCPSAVLALGRIAFDSFLRMLRDSGAIPPGARYPFRHGAHFDLPVAGLSPRRAFRLFAAYHPSQQNTQTGRLTPPMYRRLMREISRFLSS